MNNIYHIYWKSTVKVKYTALRQGEAIMLIAIIVCIAIIIVLGLDSILFTFAIIFLIIFYIGALIFLHNALNNLLKYSFVKVVKFVEDGIIITTVRDINYHIKYEDVGLIDAYEGRRYPTGDIYYYPFIMLLYYNKNLNKCIEVYLDRRVGGIFIDRYLKYCRNNNLRPCPILEGIIDNEEIRIRAIDTMKYSSFCNRRRDYKSRDWTQSRDIPPPPWLKEGGKYGRGK